MADGIKLTLTIDENCILSPEALQKAAGSAIRKVIPDMQKIMYNVTPVGNAIDDRDRHPGRLREAWVKSVDGLPTYRVTNRKDGSIGVFLYNHAKDDQDKEYCKSVNDGHLSYNQYGGPYVTYNGKTMVDGVFFIKTGINRIREDRELTNKIGSYIVKSVDRKD